MAGRRPFGHRHSTAVRVKENIRPLVPRHPFMLLVVQFTAGGRFDRMPWPFALGALFAFLIGPLALSVRAATVDGIHKIQHIVVIMQENRSFDSYFGTFPGADGIPMQDGV